MRAIVIGAGIVGAATARSLARRGIETTILERGAAVSGTSSAGEGNILVSDKAPGAELALAQYSSRLWPVVAAQLREELPGHFPPIEFERKGGLVVATSAEGAASLREFARRQRGAGVEARELTVDEAIQLEPELTRRLTAAVHYPDDAQVQPVIAAEALLASARLSGVRVLTDEPVIGGIRSASGELVGVTTSRSDYRADAVVVAAGPWSGDVSAILGARLPVLPRRGVVLVTTRMTQRIFHKVYDADYVGAVESGDSGLQTSSVVESTKSGTVLIGSSREQVGFDSTLRVRVLEELAAKAMLLFPFLAEQSVMRSYGGFRPYMPDHLPVIGRDERLPGLWHASGHEGAGIGLSLATGELVAALIDGAATAVDSAPFSPGRDSLAPFLTRAAA
jgi:glycine/D-amino acid oxidase-like deaminating enzyme